MYFCVYRVLLGVCIQVTPFFHRRFLGFPEYLDTGGMQFPLVFAGFGLQLMIVPNHCTLSLVVFNVLWGIYVPVGRWVLPGLFLPLIVNTPFIQM